MAVPGLEEIHNHGAPGGPFRALSGTKLAQHACSLTQNGTKLAQHRKNRPFWAIFGPLGENCHAQGTNTPSRATFFSLWVRPIEAGQLVSRHQRRFRSRGASSSSQPPAWATESSRWHSHGIHVHHVAWRLGCSERNIAPAWDCACRHEIQIAPARLKPLILTLFRRAGVVFLSRRLPNTQHSGAQGRCFFHEGYRTRNTVVRRGDVSFTKATEHAAQRRAGAMFLSLSGRSPDTHRAKQRQRRQQKDGMQSKHTKRGQ